MSDRTEFEAIADCIAGMTPLEFSEMKSGAVALPDSYCLADTEKFQLKPLYAKGQYSFRTTKSLALYLDRFQRPETVAFSNRSEAKICVTIDHHNHVSNEPSHCSHQAIFDAQFTPQYAKWRAIDGKPMTQVSAGQFLEERALDVKNPDPATIMDMVMQFDALKKVTFKQSTRLHDGQRQFQYLEENEARGNVTLPEAIKVLVPVFEGQEPDTILVRVKYRIEDGSLRFAFEIHDRDLVEQIAFERCEDALAKDATDLLILQTV